MKVFLFRDYLKSVHGEPVSDDQIICHVGTINEFPRGLCEIGGKLYGVCMIEKPGDSIYVERVKQPIQEDEVSFSREITCPHCGHEESDSWECSDREDERECGTCGSVFSYERNIEITYSSEIVERNEEITRLNLQGAIK